MRNLFFVVLQAEYQNRQQYKFAQYDLNNIHLISLEHLLNLRNNILTFV